MLLASSGWKSPAWAAPVKPKANAAARMVRWMVILSLLGLEAGSAQVTALAPISEGCMIIDQIDRIDSGHRLYQFKPRRPEPACRPRCIAHGAQRYARGGSRRPQAVGHEPQPRPAAHAVRRRA